MSTGWASRVVSRRWDLIAFLACKSGKVTKKTVLVPHLVKCFLILLISSIKTKVELPCLLQKADILAVCKIFSR